MVVSAIIVALAAAEEMRAPLNTDAHWILTIAGRLISGERLYQDILEINPPLIVWLQLPLVWLARATGLDPAAVFRGAVLLLCIAMALIAMQSVSRSRFVGRHPGLQWWVAPALLFVLLLVPAGGFGQREQIITALLLPLIGVTSLRLEGASVPHELAAAGGVAAGLAVALKPFFAVVWMVFLAARFLRPRRLQLEPEDLAMVGVGVMYVAAVAALAPRFFTILRIFGPTYAAFTPADSILFVVQNAATVWAASAMIAWMVRRERDDSVGLTLTLALSGAFMAALLQGKGWSYHFIPAVCLSVLLGLVALASRAAVPSTVRRASRALTAILLLLAWIPLLQRTASRLRPAAARPADPVGPLSSAVARERGARSILVLSADMTSAMPWIAHLRLASHASFPFLWVPTVVYRSRWNGNPQVAFRDRTRMPGAEAAAYDAVVSDFVRHTPDILVVETRIRNERLTGYPGGFDHLVYYGRDSQFAACFLEFRLTAALRDYLVFRRQNSGDGRRKACSDGG
jgi:hypothetical protein